MKPERWKKVNKIFQEVLELESDEQKEYLEKACADDESLFQQVETLLAANDQAGTFIVGNAAKDVAHLLTLKNSKTLTGESLGHYNIVSILGSGGMGKVYLAKDSKLNRSIAVKTLPNSFSKDSDHVKRFQTEAKAAANLNHPNVATIYSVEETDENQTFITMEYVEGKILSDMFSSDGIDQRTFLDLFVAIADALSHAHEKGIVHRDIKPSNIMITPAGNPKILDFGLAQIDKSRLGDDDSTLSLTKTGQVLGTPAYMSPEQAEGKEADHRTDIFSLGVVMYEAITGERPFKGDNYAKIVSNLLNTEPRNITEFKPKVPYLLARIIMKCLSKKPRYRYQSMSEVRVLLKEVNSAIDSKTSLSRPEQIVAKPVSKSLSTYILYGLVGFFAFLALATSGVWFFTNKSSNGAEISRFTIELKKGANLGVLDARLSPDGRNIVLQNFNEDGIRFHLRSLDSFEIKSISGTENARKPFLSSDGKWLAFETKSNSLKKVPIEGGNPITICDLCPTIRDSNWASNDTIYYATNKGLFSIAADGGTSEQLTTIDREGGERDHYYPQLLPDEKTVMFSVAKNGQPKLALLSLADKKWSYIEETGKAWRAKYSPTGHIIFARDNQLMAIPFDLSSLKTSGKPVLLLSDLFAMAPNFHISDNGTLIYLPAIIRTNNQVVWVDKKGETTPAINKKGDFSSPKVSPDGTRIAVRLETDIWVYNLETETGIRLTNDGKNEIPLWTRDGKSIIYTTKQNNKYTVYKKNADGTGEAEEITNNNFKISPYSIHPTEEIIAFSSTDTQGNTDIVTKSLDGGKKENFVNTKFREDTPSFSPDGKWLTYFSMDTRHPKIYAESWGGERKKIPVTKETGMFPTWSPKGNKLFYRSARKIFSLDVDTTNGFEVSNRKFLFEGKHLTSFDVSPDGEKFLMVRDEHGTLPNKMNIILNWQDELKAKMKNSQ